LDGRHFEVDVDAAEQRGGDAVVVLALDLDGGAAAFALRVAVEAARAGAECGDEDEVGGESHRAGGAGGGDAGVPLSGRRYSCKSGKKQGLTPPAG